jgi:hypothetical protein
MPVAGFNCGFAAAAEEWKLLSSPALKPGTTRVRIPVNAERSFLSGFKLGVDGSALVVRKLLLHRGPRSLTIVDVNRELLPGQRTDALFPAGGPFLLRAIGVEYEALTTSAPETVVRVWITG